MNTLFLITLPLMTALIGWLTNLVAIRMLFRPKREIRILGWPCQGIIPRRQQDLATRTAEIIEKELLTTGVLERQIQEIDLKPFLRDYARHLVHEGLGEKLRRIPVFGGLVNKPALMKLEKLLASEMQRQAGPLLVRLSSEVEKHIPVRELVEQKMSALNVDDLERMVNQVAKKEFKTIEALGAVLGFVVGLVQLGVLILTGNVQW